MLAQSDRTSLTSGSVLPAPAPHLLLCVTSAANCLSCSSSRRSSPGLVYAFLPQPVEVDLVEVERGDVRVTVDEDGKTRIREKYVVSAPLNGRILRISMDPGDEVDAGKTLLTMIEPRDPELLDARSVAQAEARVKAAEATLRQAEPELEEARAAQALCRSGADARSQGGPEQRGFASRSWKTPRYVYRQRSEELRSAQDRRGDRALRAGAGRGGADALAAASRRHRATSCDGDGTSAAMAIANAADGDTTNGNGWNFPIYSPINGRVLRVFQESAAVVTPGTPLVELGDPTRSGSRDRRALARRGEDSPGRPGAARALGRRRGRSKAACAPSSRPASRRSRRSASRSSACT